jgi:predicted ATPase
MEPAWSPGSRIAGQYCSIQKIDCSANWPATSVPGRGLPLKSKDPGLDLVDLVRSRKLLIILDSCEHVIETVALLAEKLYQETEQVDEAETRVWFLFECGRSA